jgi:class 3 adenylate cyclase
MVCSCIFGYPRAHEDDAERAIRAGLKLNRAVTALGTSAPLQTQVGVATGLVVVGNRIGTGAGREQTIVGETPNLAACLQGVAQPNMVVIAESTRRLLGNLFELEHPDHLATVYSWFTEGFDTLDLTQAKMLLGQLKA